MKKKNESQITRCRSCSGTGVCKSCIGTGHDPVFGYGKKCVQCNGSGGVSSVEVQAKTDIENYEEMV